MLLLSKITIFENSPKRSVVHAMEEDYLLSAML